MPNTWKEKLPELLEALGLDEEPMGIFYTDNKPEDGFAPHETVDLLPTREKEEHGQIDWGQVFGEFSCAIGNIWRARRKNTAAYFSQDRFGCPGGAFWLGYLKPQTDLIVHYVSSGIPGQMEGEGYMATPEECRSLFEHVDPKPARADYLVLKHLSLFEEHETPEMVAFFARPEVVSGLHQLAAFVTGRAEVVRSPWSSACGSLVAWPFHYQSRGEDVAVLGGWDPSARKFFKTDELSFTVSMEMFQAMLDRWPDSFMSTKSWQTVKKKIALSKKTWAGR